LLLTWHTYQYNKVSDFYDDQFHFICYQWIAEASAGTGATGSLSPEAAQRHMNLPDYNTQVKWSAPITNKLLLEAGAGFVNFGSGVTTQPGVCCALNSITELSTNFVYRSPVTYAGTTNHSPNYLSHMFNERVTASYITGSHPF